MATGGKSALKQLREELHADLIMYYVVIKLLLFYFAQITDRLGQCRPIHEMYVATHETLCENDLVRCYMTVLK